MTPTSVRLLKPPSAAAAASPHSAHKAQPRLHSPSPAILNFTLQNRGLISGPGPGGGPAASQAPERLSPLALQPRGMVFLKPVSPSSLQQQQVALIGVQQVKRGRGQQEVRNLKVLFLFNCISGFWPVGGDMFCCAGI